MVISPENPPPPPDQMAAAPARAESQSNLHNFSFPVLKKWGSQRVLRCVKVDRNGEAIRSPPTQPPPISRSAPVARGGDEDEPLEKESPWNLRTRRGQVKDQGVSREERGGHVRTVRLRSEDAERRERPRFSVSLTREEIDEDVYALTGARARRRPKKRPRSVQKQLDVSLRRSIFEF